MSGQDMSCTLRQMTIGFLAPDLRDDGLTVSLRRPGDAGAGAGEEGGGCGRADGCHCSLAVPTVWRLGSR